MGTATFNATKAKTVALRIQEKLAELQRRDLEEYLSARTTEINKGFFHKLFKLSPVTPDDVRMKMRAGSFGDAMSLATLETRYFEEFDACNDILRAVQAGATTIEIDLGLLGWYDGD